MLSAVCMLIGYTWFSHVVLHVALVNAIPQIDKITSMRNAPTMRVNLRLVPELAVTVVRHAHCYLEIHG